MHVCESLLKHPTEAEHALCVQLDRESMHSISWNAVGSNKCNIPTNSRDITVLKTVEVQRHPITPPAPPHVALTWIRCSQQQQN